MRCPEASRGQPRTVKRGPALEGPLANPGAFEVREPAGPPPLAVPPPR
ncbi:hypothetical protein G4177_26375 [Corallococcus sp. ZKHCc1 1396]|uniref:Uncharacterized protein n=1 Tax=Corallococcus soli TaxID=2710757 RepID=A0ABR9PVA7_9BACT|nr:hypothetical protein [Corallococcus soli]MBE4751702.1 hypothetical protein [Corallococcus soli]